jgi:putative hydrolase of the HAD superfamily/5'-nucleotidase
MRFVDQYDVILLDLNGTFMFGQDRFGPDQDYHHTYVSLGGRGLSRDSVQHLVAECHREMSRAYDDPARYEDFPGHAEVLHELCRAPLEEIPLLEQVMTAHELGSVPAAHAECLALLARSHDLGIVSNIWGRPDAWLRHLEEVGLRGLFKCIVFSSEGRSMKPSPTLFRRAGETFPPTSRVLFVGDSHERDVVPAKALGWGAAWIAPANRTSPVADATVSSLLELPGLERG